jgi:hypothetical protein
MLRSIPPKRAAASRWPGDEFFRTSPPEAEIYRTMKRRTVPHISAGRSVMRGTSWALGP